MKKTTCCVIALLLCVAFSCQRLPPAVVQGQPTAPIMMLSTAEPTRLEPSQPAVMSPTASPRHLSICLGQEPKSLFLYDAVGPAAQGILAAIYDGPFEIQHFNIIPILLEQLPSLSDESMRLEPVSVEPASTIVDANGYVNTLAEGVRYRPSGCFRQECAQVYAGDQPAILDQWVIRFQLLPNLSWSDGSPLRADDSVYSYEVARALYPSALPELLLRTASYQTVDERTVEWKGVPGYLDTVIGGKFFSPLPRHLWGHLSLEELRTAEMTVRRPLGWGAYVIEEWVSGDHITLVKNPYYFRASQGLPHFDHLVFRFVLDGQSALQALLAGECDLMEASIRIELSLQQLEDLESQGKIKVNLLPERAWEIALFGIDSQEETRPDFFADPTVRQAIALCMDRQAVVDRVFLGKTQVARSYLPEDHPLFNPNLPALDYDPQRASQMLQEFGWVDMDDLPETPRVAQGVAGVEDGTPLEFEYLVSSEGERQAVAEILRASLAQCGIRMVVVPQEAVQYLAPGPEGAVFGRRFTMAQFAWPLSSLPLCGLFLTQEIPGPYPDFPKGWGGANASGYSREEFDQTCLDALYALPEFSGYTEVNWRAQELFMMDLPAVPLYWHFAVELARPDLCGMAEAGVARTSLTLIEQLNFGEGCAD